MNGRAKLDANKRAGFQAVRPTQFVGCRPTLDFRNGQRRFATT